MWTADLLFNIFRKTILFLICLFVFNNLQANSYELDSYGSNFDSGFGESYMIKKKQLTPEEKEQQRSAKEILKSKKIALSEKNFINYAKKNNTEIVKLMLDAGMSPNTDYYGEYALYYAARSNKTDMIKLLLDYGAKPNIGFDSALYWAVKKKNTDAALLLIERGAKINYTDLVSGQSILYAAIKTNQINLAKELIKMGAKMDLNTARLIEKKKLKDKLEIEL